MLPENVSSEDFWGLSNGVDPSVIGNEAADDAPLSCLRPSTIQILSRLLNPIKIIPTETGILRDWRGLAELAGITSETIVFLEGKEDPTSELLKVWLQAEKRNVSDLKAFLAVIDRFDAVEDASESLDNDVKQFCDQRSKVKLSSSASVRELSDSDRTILTIDDAAGRLNSRYDAFILYAEEDSDFAMQVVDKMENDYNLKMCVKERDLLGGSMFEHETVSRIIEERCNRLLVIFSPSFLKSAANQFLVSYTQALALDTRQRKIIPCIYSRCELPPSVRYSFCLDYNRSGKLWNFWDKLGQSLRAASSGESSQREKKISSMSLHSTSLPAQSHFPSSATPNGDGSSISWWEPQKLRTHSSFSFSGSGALSDLPEDFDAMSLQSESPLVSPTSPTKAQKSTKWYKKLNGPFKKKQPKKAEAVS